MGIQERKERERKKRINDILEAARRLFETKGFLRTTLQDVAREAEISVGLIYRYFQSKEDIFASLALKGAEVFDAQVDALLAPQRPNRENNQARQKLLKLAHSFFDFYGVYGEYFDMLMYSYKGLKEVQIQSATITHLMAVTLQTLEKVKRFILRESEFKANNEDDALAVVFLLWGVLLGVHKFFDASGRGHLFAFQKDEFLAKMLEQIGSGIAATPPSPPSPQNRKKTRGTVHTSSGLH